MRKPTLLLILCLAGFSAFQVVLHLASGSDEVEWDPGVLPVTNADFDETIARSQPWVVVKVWAPWCAVCKRMKPVYNEVASAFAEEIDFYRLDAEAEEDWADTYRVDGLPTLIIFYEGQEISRNSGYLPEEALRNWIAHTTGLLPDTP